MDDGYNTNYDNNTWSETLPDGTTVVHGNRLYPINSTQQDNTSVTPNVDLKYKINASDIPDIASDYWSGAKETGKDILNFAREHPASIATTLIGPEIGVPASIAAGIGGSLIDAFHPLTSETPDYLTKSPKTIIKNALLDGIINGASGYFGAPSKFNENALSDVVKGNPISRGIYPEKSFNEIGSVSDISGYNPTMIEGPSSSGFIPGQMVGNPDLNTNTLQYQDAISKLGTPDKQPIDVYRGVSDVMGQKMNPRSVLGPNGDKDADIFSTTNRDLARSYQEMREPLEVLRSVKEAINEGHPDSKELQNLVDNFQLFDSKTTQPLYKAAIEKGIIGEPGGMVQDLKVFPSNPKYLNYNNNPIFDPEGNGNIINPEELYGNYWDKGHDAIIIDNVRDPNSSMIEGATVPSRVVIVNPDARQIIKSKYNYGFWKTAKDWGNNEDLLRTIGLTSGLGAYLNKGDSK